jgi:hypothetical protein
MAATWERDRGNQASTNLAEKHPVPGVEVDNSKVVLDELNDAERGNPDEVSRPGVSEPQGSPNPQRE